MNCKTLITSLSASFLLAVTGLAWAQQSATQAPGAAAKSPTTSTAAAPAADVDELAKKLSNPISNLISVPFQYTYTRTYGDDGYQNLLNIQPVVPISISKDWNVIARTILPIIQQKDVHPGDTQFGLGDTTQSFFFSPKAPTAAGLIWGVGPVAYIPTGTDGIGANTWAFGPTIVLLKQTGPWTIGILANQLWDTGGPADINSTYLQPFITKGLGKGRTIALNSESTYDWVNDKWTIPFNLGYSKVSRMGHQLVSNYIGVKVYATTPYGNGPDWGIRYQFTLLFPKK